MTRWARRIARTTDGAARAGLGLRARVAAGLACAALLLALGIAGCGRDAPTDERGGGSPVVGRERLAVLSPAAAVILRDLGHEGLIVSRHAYDLALHPSISVSGDQAGIDYEALLRAGPTIVVTEWGARELPTRLRELSRRKGWRLHDVRLLTLADIATQTLELDALVRGGASQEGSALHARVVAWMEGRPEARLTEEEAARVGPVLLLGAASPPGALGPGSCHHELLVGLGATPAITSGRAWVELTHEDIVRFAPGAIVVFIPRPPGASATSSAEALRSADGVLSGLLDLDTPASRGGRVMVIDDPLGLLPATSLLGVGEQLARGLRAWAK